MSSPHRALLVRLGATILGLGLVAAACGGGDAQAAGSSVRSANPQIGAGTPTSTPRGFEIPAVSFTLADGTSFDLTGAGTPVMMVFWAEW